MGIGGFIVYDLRRRPVLVLHIIYNPYNYFILCYCYFSKLKKFAPAPFRPGSTTGNGQVHKNENRRRA